MKKNRPKFQNIEWSGKSMVHNMFRLFEYIFGREVNEDGKTCKIRAEATTARLIDEEGRPYIIREFYTTEAILAHVEQEIYAFIREYLTSWKSFASLEWIPNVRVVLPATPGQPGLIGIPFLLAVTYDANSVTSGYSQSSGVTLSHTTSGSNRALVVSWAAGGATPGSQFTSQAATYNSVSMTKQYTVTAGNRQSNQFTLGAPATGANNVASTWSGGGTEIKIYATSYTGVDQSTPCEAQNSSSISSGTSAAITVTTLSASAMLVGTIFVRESGLGNITCDGTIRSQDQTSAVGEKTAGAAGSNTLTFTIPSGAAGSGTTFGAVALKVGSTSYNQAVTATAVATVSISDIASFLKSLTVTALAGVSIIKQAQKTITTTAQVTASQIKQLYKELGVTAIGEAIIQASRVFLQELVATASAIASITKQEVTLVTLEVTAQATASMSMIKSFVRTITATAQASVSIVKGYILSKILEVTASATVSITRGYVLSKTLAVTAVGTATTTVQKALSMTLTVVSSAVARLIRDFGYTDKYPRNEVDYEDKYPTNSEF